MVRVPRYGKMAQNMKGIGEMVWLKVKVISITLMVMYIQVNFIKIEPMDSEYMFTRTAKLTRASGEMTCRTAPEKRNWRTDQSTMECSKMERSGAKEHTSGPTSRSTLVTGSTTTSKEKESTDGPMEGSTMDNGKKTNFTAKASTPGPTEENMKENTRMTRSMDLGPITGQTARHTKASGSTASSTEKPDSPTQREGASSDSGRTESASSGWTQRAPCDLEARNRRTPLRAALVAPW